MVNLLFNFRTALNMEGPIVEFSDGKVRGAFRENLNGDKFCAYLGVPYGKSPTGDRRFKVSVCQTILEL